MDRLIHVNGVDCIVISLDQENGSALLPMRMLDIEPSLFSPLGRIRFKPVLVGSTTNRIGVEMESSFATTVQG